MFKALTALKAKFERGDKPVEQDFIDLFDTLFGTVNTFADLRLVASTDLATGSKAQVLGNTVIGDSGLLLFYWDAASVLADDSATVIKPSDLTVLQAGRWRLLGVSTSGTGSAVVRDTTASLRALAVGTAVVALKRGDAAADDGGQALYAWVASSTALDNGQSVVIPNSIVHPAPGRWLQYF